MAKRWYYKDENGNKVPVPQYKINADDYYTKSMSDSRYYEKQATDTLLADKVSKSDIVQSTGESTTSVMSQKAVSDALSTKVDKTDITQSTGTSETAVMSQKASTMAFAANTPSGDPAHFLYESAGAKWNAGTGLWTLGSYSDLTTEEIRYAFASKVTYLSGNAFGLYHDYDCRCIFPLRIYGLGNALTVNRLLIGSKIREFMTSTMNNDSNIQLTGNSAYAFSSENIVRISSKIYFADGILDSVLNTIFSGCVKLEYIRVIRTPFGLYLNNSPLLSKESVLSMINGSKDGVTITHTLHPDVYAKCVDGGEWSAEIQTALANKTNVSLAKAE